MAAHSFFETLDFNFYVFSRIGPSYILNNLLAIFKASVRYGKKVRRQVCSSFSSYRPNHSLASNAVISMSFCFSYLRYLIFSQ